jgi:hypothetical protein
LTSRVRCVRKRASLSPFGAARRDMNAQNVREAIMTAAHMGRLAAVELLHRLGVSIENGDAVRKRLLARFG